MFRIFRPGRTFGNAAFISEETEPVSETTDSVQEALKLVSDWAKRLITVETTVIVAIGVVLKAGATVPLLAKVLGTVAIGSFLLSVVAAAALLLTLPEIIQYADHDTNVWLTRDSIAGRLLGVNTQSLAVIESILFGVGMVCVTVMIGVLIWMPAGR